MSQEKIERWDDVNGNEAPQNKLGAFMDSKTDAYAILQLHRSDETVMERFESLSTLHRMGKEPDVDHYEVVYTAALPPYTNQNMMLEGLFEKFNMNRPADFTGHSLSVSDIVALNTAGTVSFHYVDSIGFAELPGFFSGKNHLRSIEDAVEQNDNSFDGIINNLPEPEPKCKAEKEKPSVLDQLKAQQEQDFPKKSPCRKAERNME